MGKGDKKTKTGKRIIGSFGNSRRRKKKKEKHLKYYSYSFVNKNGKIVNGIEFVFPIIRKSRKGDFIFLGTGFFINAYGGFVTAKHVVLDNKGKFISPLYIVQVLSNNHFSIRFVEKIDINPNSDAAVCMLSIDREANGELRSNQVLVMSKNYPNVGDEIKTFAYPKSKIISENDKIQIGEFSANWYRGKVVEFFPTGRDKTLLPFPCFQTSIRILGGASGGPVMDKLGNVIGINSTGFDLDNEDDNNSISFITPIQEVFDIKVMIAKDKYTTIGELVENKSVKID